MLSVAPLAAPRRRFSPPFAAVFATLCVLDADSVRAAEADEWLQPSTRSGWYAASIGPGIGVCARRRCGFGVANQFQLVNEVGWHLDGGDGPAIGGLLLVGAGGGAVRFSPQFKFWWDIPIVSRYAIYLTPGASIGYSVFSYSSGFEGANAHALALQGTLAGRVVLKNRGFAFFQPVGIETLVDGDGPNFGYSVLAGGGLTF